MFHETQSSTLNVGWGVMYGITAILGAWGSGTLGQSDWTRYANRPMAPSLAQLVAAPVAITITALIGIIVTSAAQNMLGEIVWNPIYLLADIQEFYGSSPRARAGVFFASIGMVSTQLAVRQRKFQVAQRHTNIRKMIDFRSPQFHVYWHGHGWSSA